MKKKMIFVLLLLTFTAAACGETQTADQNDTRVFENAVNTAVAETLVASLSNAAPASVDVASEVGQALSAEEPSDSVVEEPAEDSPALPTPLPVVSAFEADASQETAAETSSESVSLAEVAVVADVDTSAAAASSSGANVDDDGPPCYSVTMVSETIPDGAVFHPGDGFAKSWTLKNTGSCEWGPNFRFVWVAGNSKFHASTDTKLTNQQILPGDTVTVTLEMGAPTEPGLYIGLYKIYNGNGLEITPYGVWLSVWVDYE